MAGDYDFCPYRVLGVTAGASDAQINSAYRSLCRTCHPDKGGDPEEFRKLASAKDILLDPARRREYDEAQSGRQPQRDGYHQSVYYLTVTVASLYRDTSHRIRYERLERDSAAPQVVVMSVTVPRGSCSGSRHEFPAWGDYDPATGQHRALVVVVTATQSSVLWTAGTDVHSHVRLGLLAALGCQPFTVCLPDGSLAHVPQLDRVYAPASTVVLRGHGLPSAEAGDLHLKVLVSFPSEISPAVREALARTRPPAAPSGDAIDPARVQTLSASAEFPGSAPAAAHGVARPPADEGCPIQ
jgi:DnaJ-class molecular chaperone